MSSKYSVWWKILTKDNIGMWKTSNQSYSFPYNLISLSQYGQRNQNCKSKFLSQHLH